MRDNDQGGAGAANDFNALARQYWNAWGEAMRNAAPGAAQAGTQPWQEALAWWSRAAQADGGQGNETIGRFNAQAQHWLAQMQQVAAQFAGRDAGATEVAAAWKQAMDAIGGNPFRDMLQGMGGPGLQGFEQWLQQAAPWLEGLRNEGMSWLRMPAFGFAREHQERWQRLARAQADYQQRTQAYDALMRKATQDAYAIFERKLAECAQPDRQLQSARALFDLWIDAAEDAYAQIALSPEFREVYGQLVDAQMRLRARVQREVEQVCVTFGMPTRTELDGAHRKIVELERQLRRLRDNAGAAARSSSAAPKRSTTKASTKAKQAGTVKKASAAKRSRTVKPAASKPAGSKKPVATRGASK